MREVEPRGATYSVVQVNITPNIAFKLTLPARMYSRASVLPSSCDRLDKS